MTALPFDEKVNDMEHHLEQTVSGSLWNLEKKLSSFLEPVTPDPVFVDTLRLKLQKTPAVLVETGRRKLGLLVMGMGMFAGVLVYWLLRKRPE